MSAERLLARLEGVRSTGPGRWLAKCPAHEDRRPSLSVREASDGRVLLYCFTGCGATDVLAAVGLDYVDLYPEKKVSIIGYSPSKPSRVPAEDALHVLDLESLVVEIIARRLEAGEPMSDAHRADLVLAAGRIGAVATAWRLSP